MNIDESIDSAPLGMPTEDLLELEVEETWSRDRRVFGR